ncbi:MAG TPA: nuclear transport factor 2 family protein [Terriglobia bacterium]|nr:nuclear transport factor 2 family protein [Terriglobia bacterium]
MNKLVDPLKILLLLPPLALLAVRASAQNVLALQDIRSQAELDKTVSTLDTELFDAVNRCELEKLASLIDDQIEFFHDSDGLTFGKQSMLDSVRNNICGTDFHRVLVPGTLRAYPMKGYGALEIGVHQFLHPKTHGAAGEASFIHLWQYKDGAWKLTRVISYNHHVLK